MFGGCKDGSGDDWLLIMHVITTIDGSAGKSGSKSIWSVFSMLLCFVT